MNRTALAIGLILAGTTAIAATTATAQGYRNSGTVVDVRQDNQKHRIATGIRNGDIDRREARRLIEQQRAIASFERRAKSDGRIDARERAILNEMQNKASRTIARMRHNDRNRFTSYDRPGPRRTWTRRFWW